MSKRANPRSGDFLAALGVAIMGLTAGGPHGAAVALTVFVIADLVFDAFGARRRARAIGSTPEVKAENLQQIE